MLKRATDKNQYKNMTKYHVFQSGEYSSWPAFKSAVSSKTGLKIEDFEIRDVIKVFFGGTYEVWYAVKGQSDLKSVKL